MQALLTATSVVALAEIGDKTQLLSLVLTARYRQPWPIVAGIAVATLANHAMAGAVGAWVMAWLGPETMRWLLGGSFLAMAAWMLVPDQLDDDEDQAKRAAHGTWAIFGATVAAFFLAEMGDKTQVATVMLAARYPDTVAVVAGTTLGMLLANVPVVWLGERAMRALPQRAVHLTSAAIFAALGAWAIWA